jgi:hypothetical protein
MGCCGIQGDKEEAEEEKKMKKTNKEIEKQIQKDKQVTERYRRTG